MLASLPCDLQGPVCRQFEPVTFAQPLEGRKSLNFMVIDGPQNEVISGFQALRQARAPVPGLEPATDESLQISGRIRYIYEKREG
ncbi:hypothetical protein PoB_003047800 [Plakobranchus ocellatus]|uniref:Uncharacterized protein n=1 Tax=Plakobranchus ocellatus TaxID=259542 RepID=A0AAV4ABK9_9GAST|nr:hypothetical protein PoB_003047800 [Plakobranchus ocellatus]